MTHFLDSLCWAEDIGPLLLNLSGLIFIYKNSGLVIFGIYIYIQALWRVEYNRLIKTSVLSLNLRGTYQR